MGDRGRGRGRGPLADVDRQKILRIIFDKVEEEPPVGERYELLLQKIIEESISDSGEKLKKADKETLLDELFDFVASYGPIESYFYDPDISEIMVNKLCEALDSMFQLHRGYEMG